MAARKAKAAAEAANFLPLPDGSRAWLYRWLPQAAPRGVVQIVHGMAEHALRYARVAAALNAEGYAVYAQDLPGHGQTAASLADLGHAADSAEGSWRRMVKAVHGVRAHIEQQHPGVPLTLFGHSMGSFIAQDHLVEHGAGLASVVLSGSSGSLGPLRAVGLALNRAQMRLFGPSHRSALTEALTFKAFNGQFKPARTASDWLSRDEAEVDAYVRDAYCGFRCSASLWAGLLSAGGALLDPTRLARIPKSLPVLLIAGSTDPVCEGGRGSHLLAEHYRKAGMTDVTTMIYEDARHELLNETCREAVTADVLGWIGGAREAGD